MAQNADHHVKLIIGDMVLTIAKLAAENEALRENQKPVRKPKRQ